MSTTELPPEKRTAGKPLPDELIPESPPVHPEPLLNTTEPDTDSSDPPQSRLLITGFSREEITAEFLIAIHDLGDDHDLNIESISVGQPDDE